MRSVEEIAHEWRNTYSFLRDVSGYKTDERFRSLCVAIRALINEVKADKAAGK